MRKIIFILVFSILFSACSTQTEIETTTEEYSAAVDATTTSTTTTIFVQPSEERAKEIDIDRFVKLELGLATGYTGNDIVPFMRYTDRGWFIAPAYEYDNKNIGLTFGYEWKIK